MRGCTEGVYEQAAAGWRTRIRLGYQGGCVSSQLHYAVMLEDQPHKEVGCQRSLPGNHNVGEILPACCLCQAVFITLPCILVIWEVRRLTFEHLDREPAAQRPVSANLAPRFTKVSFCSPIKIRNGSLRPCLQHEKCFCCALSASRLVQLASSGAHNAWSSSSGNLVNGL